MLTRAIHWPIGQGAIARNTGQEWTKASPPPPRIVTVPERLSWSRIVAHVDNAVSELGGLRNGESVSGNLALTWPTVPGRSVAPITATDLGRTRRPTQTSLQFSSNPRQPVFAQPAVLACELQNFPGRAGMDHFHQ